MPVTHLITGFGLDRRALECLELPKEQFRCADLMDVERHETLPHYALRLTETIRFQSGDAVGGLSLGGMLALEIANQCGASSVLLMASCTQPQFIRPVFRAAGRVARWTPEAALHLLFSNIPVVLHLLGMHTAQSSSYVRDIMSAFPPRLIQQLPRMILDWEGCEPTVPCRALHSEHDWLIRPPLHLSNLTLIPGKTHLITVSRPNVTRDFLLEA